MDYNTARNNLTLPEYGRHIHKMVDHVKATVDRTERNRLAKAVIEVMGNMNPHLRDIQDFKHKLWDHIYIMSDFDLDIDSPYPIPEREKIFEKPGKLPYPNKRIRLKYYGKTIEEMIVAATTFEDGPEKDLLYGVLANHMKKTFLRWNTDSVTDTVIFNDINRLSDNKLKTPEGLVLTETKDIVISKPRKKKPERSDKRRYKKM